jgi:hypothetical protein
MNKNIIALVSLVLYSGISLAALETEKMDSKRYLAGGPEEMNCEQVLGLFNQMYPGQRSSKCESVQKELTRLCSTTGLKPSFSMSFDIVRSEYISKGYKDIGPIVSKMGFSDSPATFNFYNCKVRK